MIKLSNCALKSKTFTFLYLKKKTIKKKKYFPEIVNVNRKILYY